MDDDEIQRHIADLKAGGQLTKDSISAIAIAIGKKFRELAELWGERFTNGAWVEMEEGVRLHFCEKEKDGWRFRIVTDNNGECYVQSASLRLRQLAVECLPDLEKALVEVDVSNVDKDRLIAAVKILGKFLADERAEP